MIDTFCHEIVILRSHNNLNILTKEVYMKKEESPIEMWRWKMIRKVADYINEPDDLNMSELKAMIESYRDYHNIRNYISAENRHS